MDKKQTREEIKAESRAELERRVAAGIPHGPKGDKLQETSSTFGGHVVPVRDDTEGHVEGPVGTWNTSGTEVAKPVAWERDRYDEQNRNSLRSHGMTAADQAYRLAEQGNEVIVEAVQKAQEETPTEVTPLPQNNTTRMATELGVSVDEALESETEEKKPRSKKTDK